MKDKLVKIVVSIIVKLFPSVYDEIIVQHHHSLFEQAILEEHGLSTVEEYYDMMEEHNQHQEQVEDYYELKAEEHCTTIL